MAPNRYDRTRNGKAKIPRRTESGRKEDNMAKFKVGDRVKIVDNRYTNCKVGDIGTIKGIRLCGVLPYAFELDHDMEGSFHSCDGLTNVNRGQWVCSVNIELIEPEFKLVVISKGDKTKAKLYREESLEKEVEVNRYYKDEYSEKAAVEAVTKKIFGEDEKKEELFNGKVVCLMDLTYIPKYTKGRVYEFVNGNCKDDYGNVINFRYTLEEVEKSKWFLPIVE